MEPSISYEEVSAIVHSTHSRPHSVLGRHKIIYQNHPAYVIRAYRPDAKKIEILDKSSSQAACKMGSAYYENFFEYIFRTEDEFDYALRITDHEGSEYVVDDPYAFSHVIDDFDAHLFAEGNNHEIYNWLGAHKKTIRQTQGYHFAVWAPNAVRVSIIGDFNHWDGRYHQMSMTGDSGIWEIFIPGISQNTRYKYEIKTRTGHLLEKIDPYGFLFEVPPNSATLTQDLDNFTWEDPGWMEQRKNRDFTCTPISIYEIHLGSWRKKPEEHNRSLTYREMAHEVVNYVLEMGYTHIELMPVSEHPFDGSWGYQAIGYYAPTSRFGMPEDFMYFVNHCHKNNIGVIVDWVPAHFPKDGHGLAWFDGTALYEYPDSRKGEHKDWGTLIFNYGRNEVRNFLLANALFWFDVYHIDGMRVDAVASMLYLDYSRRDGEWVPNCNGGRENLDAVYFLKRFNELVHQYFPGALTIAEESTSWPAVSRPTYTGGLGFSLKWNMGWMNDFLTYLGKDPVYRKYHHDMLTFMFLYAFTENFIQVLSHDEVVHGKRALVDKMPGNCLQKFANTRLLHGFMYGYPGKKLLFQGGELGQWNEWDHRSSIDWHLLQYAPHQKLQQYIKDLNFLYQKETALYEIDCHPSGFEWIDFQDWQQSIICFTRRGRRPDNILIFVFNFTPVMRDFYRIGVPAKVFYREIMNSDSEKYGGQNGWYEGGIYADDLESHGKKYSLEITIPPLTMLIFKPEYK
jgi:1,4-alpha-glucan branching enzyme